MSDPISTNAPQSDPLLVAEARLNQAIDRVATRIAALEVKAQAGGDVDEDDHLEIVKALEDAHAREEQLSSVAQEASEALGVAIQELQTLKNQADEPATAPKETASEEEAALDER